MNMNGSVNFCGASGASYRFERGPSEGAAIAGPGIALFAAGDCSGWRVIDVVDVAAGHADAFEWRWRKARRYGATAVFVRLSAAAEIGRLEAVDLRLGLDPVFSQDAPAQAKAA